MAPTRVQKIALTGVRSGRRKRREVPDAEGLLDAGDLVDHLLEAAVRQRLLAILEHVLQPRQLALTDERAKGGEEHGVLARGVRLVHADDLAQRLGDRLAAGVALHACGGGEPLHLGGELAAGLMLRAQRGDEVGQLVGLLEAREDELLFVLLVIVLDEGADDERRVGEGVGRYVLARVEAAQDLAVDEEHATEDAVLAHEIFGRGDLVLVLVLLVCCRRGAGHEERGPAGEELSTRGCHAPVVGQSRQPIQLKRPRSAMAAGTSSRRTTVASSATASAMPRPSALMNTTGAAAKAEKTTIMMAAAPVTRRPVRARPSTMAPRVSCVRSQASRMRLMMRTS